MHRIIVLFFLNNCLWVFQQPNWHINSLNGFYENQSVGKTIYVSYWINKPRSFDDCGIQYLHFKNKSSIHICRYNISIGGNHFPWWPFQQNQFCILFKSLFFQLIKAITLNPTKIGVEVWLNFITCNLSCKY